MAFRTWGRLLLTALGVSVLAGAGQLGVAYGFGIVRLTGAFTGTTVNQWPAQLVWVGWFAANAAVAGAVLTGRLARRDIPAASTGRQLAIGGAAALGATAVAPLCMQPARAAELISVDPVWAVGICAVLGAVIGAGAAIAVLLRPELGWNMAAVAGAVWLLALISVLPSLGTAGPLPTVRLGVLEPSWLDDDVAQRLALLLLPITALLAGAATAGLARWRGQVPLISGATGVAGPVLVAFAYLTAGPGDTVDRYQTTPYYGALIAVLAGALGAAAAALLRWPVRANRTDSQAIEPTTILRPLPTGLALPNARPAGSADDSTDDSTADDSTTGEPTAGARTALGTIAGEPSAIERTGTGRPPHAADSGVRTVPAHWDWPAATAGGQHGPVPADLTGPDEAGASRPAAAPWVTAPTGEFSAARHEPAAGRDEAAAVSSPLAGLDSSLAADPTDRPLSNAAATVEGGTTPPTEAIPTGDRRPTGRTGTDADNPTMTDRDTLDPTTTDPTTPDRDMTSASSTDLGDMTTTGADAAPGASTPKPRRSRKPKSTPVASARDEAGTLSTTEAAPTDLAAAGTAAPVSTPAHAPASTPADAPASTTADGPASTPADPRAGAGTPAGASTPAGAGTPAGPGAVAPGRAEADASARAATDAPAGSGTTATATTAATAMPTTAASTGRARKAARSGTDGPQPTVDVPAAPAASAVPAAPATSVAPAAAAAPATPAAPATSVAPAAPAASAARPSPDEAGRGATTPSATEAATATRSTGTTRRTDHTGTEQTGTDRFMAGDSSHASLFGSEPAGGAQPDRWTPAPPAWPVTPGRTVSAPAEDAGSTVPEARSTPDPAEWTLRPRHRAPLPDLSRASTWDAFNTTRRGGSTDAQPGSTDDSSTAPTGTTEPSDPPAPAEAASATTPDERGESALDRAAARWRRAVGTSDRNTGSAPSGADPATDPVPTSSSPVVPGQAGTLTDDGPASVDPAPVVPTPRDEPEQPTRRGRLGGLFRRNRSRTDEETPNVSNGEEPLPAQDEEFVDWVAGLGKPVPDNEPEQESGRRSMRSTGRHHRD
ncbi:hypothetical protein [Micromonospora sp. NPDC050695]|uniref:hypothetical protein n=1 Tax=Micromonospora sp. NPDC050695 TaxID=3154938 RepID=UPI0033D75D98